MQEDVPSNSSDSSASQSVVRDNSSETDDAQASIEAIHERYADLSSVRSSHTSVSHEVPVVSFGSASEQSGTFSAPAPDGHALSDDDDDSLHSLGGGPPVEEVRPCPLCPNANLGCVDGVNISDADQVIVQLRARLRMDFTDDVVFGEMLSRRRMIERLLDEYGIPHVKWTLGVLRTHFGSLERPGHVEDPIRPLDVELARIDRYIESLEENMYEHNPETGVAELSYRAHQYLEKWSKRKTDLLKERHTLLQSLKNETDGFHQQLQLLERLQRLRAPIAAAPAAYDNTLDTL